MEEEDKKAELNSEIWKKHQKKEAKDLKKIFKINFDLYRLNVVNCILYALTYIANPI